MNFKKLVNKGFDFKHYGSGKKYHWDGKRGMVFWGSGIEDTECCSYEPEDVKRFLKEGQWIIDGGEINEREKVFVNVIKSFISEYKNVNIKLIKGWHSVNSDWGITNELSTHLRNQHNALYNIRNDYSIKEVAAICASGDYDLDLDIVKAVTKIVYDVLTPPYDFPKDQPITKYGMDSLDTVEMVMLLEEKYSIDISDVDAQRLSNGSIYDIAKEIKKKIDK